MSAARSLSLEDQINALCRNRLGRLPNLVNPRGYNDVIQWLKLYDQTPEHVIACDKYAVREWVAERVGEGVLNRLLYVADEPLEGVPTPYMLKATHDSGSTYKIRQEADLVEAIPKLREKLGRVYGAHKGEWAYSFVKPRVIAEELMPEPIIDYKFHCTHGKVRWVQVIWDRDSGQPKEAIFLPDGTLTDLHMDHKMVHAPGVYPGDDEWSELTEVAETLAEGWRYVRVDLYYVMGVKFGELTFWPLSGSYKTDDEPTFGRMLEIDLSHKRKPLVV